MNRPYAKAAAAHRIATNLDIPFGAAWRVANCLSKVSYKSMADALCAAGFFESKGSRQRPYECDVCGQWHLTSKAEREDQAKEGGRDD